MVYSSPGNVLHSYAPSLVPSISELWRTVNKPKAEPKDTARRSSLASNITFWNTKKNRTPLYNREHMHITPISTAVPIGHRTVSYFVDIHLYPHFYAPITTLQRAPVANLSKTSAVETRRSHSHTMRKNGCPLKDVTASTHARLRLSSIWNISI